MTLARNARQSDVVLDGIPYGSYPMQHVSVGQAQALPSSLDPYYRRSSQQRQSQPNMATPSQFYTNAQSGSAHVTCHPGNRHVNVLM